MCPKPSPGPTVEAAGEASNSLSITVAGFAYTRRGFRLALTVIGKLAFQELIISSLRSWRQWRDAHVHGIGKVMALLVKVASNPPGPEFPFPGTHPFLRLFYASQLPALASCRQIIPSMLRNGPQPQKLSVSPDSATG